jgi:hypothetical protein
MRYPGDTSLPNTIEIDGKTIYLKYSRFTIWNLEQFNLNNQSITLSYGDLSTSDNNGMPKVLVKGNWELSFKLENLPDYMQVFEPDFTFDFFGERITVTRVELAPFSLDIFFDNEHRELNVSTYSLINANGETIRQYAKGRGAAGWNDIRSYNSIDGQRDSIRAFEGFSRILTRTTEFIDIDEVAGILFEFPNNPEYNFTIPLI